jgi:enolase-phosphatase E1
VGSKTEPESYRRITAAIGVAPGEILFLSDREPELDAAVAAGWQAVWLARPADTAPDTRCAFAPLRSFDEIAIVRSAGAQIASRFTPVR